FPTRRASDLRRLRGFAGGARRLLVLRRVCEGDRGRGCARREPLAVLRPRRHPHDADHRRPRGPHRPVHAGGEVTGGARQARGFGPAGGSASSTGGVTGSSLNGTAATGPAHESELTWLSTRQLASKIASGQVSAR